MNETSHGSPYRVYWVTWGILLVITVAMLAAEKFHMPRWFLLVFLLIPNEKGGFDTPERTESTPVSREGIPALLESRFRLPGFALGDDGSVVPRNP